VRLLVLHRADIDLGAKTIHKILWARPHSRGSVRHRPHYLKLPKSRLVLLRFFSDDLLVGSDGAGLL